MATTDDVYRELHAEPQDDYRGAAPAYMILRGEQVVGYVFLDADTESWRYGPSRDTSADLPVARPEQAVEQGLRTFAAELADG